MNLPFILVASTTAKLCRVLVGKMAKKCHFFTFFGVTRQNFLGSRWNILTNEPLLERLLNFWIFGTYFKLIEHLVRAREPPKAKKSKIRVTRKPDLETQNWVYSFSSFIEPYQTHIVTVQMLSTFFHLLDRVHGKKIPRKVSSEITMASLFLVYLYYRYVVVQDIVIRVFFIRDFVI